MVTKIDVFKNIVYQIKSWNDVAKAGELPTLKILKLLFFISANSEKLLSYFDFHCQPYGHMDKELLTHIKKNSDFGFFKLGSQKTEFKDVPVDFMMDYGINYEIIKSIELIERQEPRFIHASSFDLIDLNKAWYCFKVIYKKDKPYCFPCCKKLIYNEDKYFYIKDLHK